MNRYFPQQEPADQIRRLRTENQRLLDENQRLHQELERAKQRTAQEPEAPGPSCHICERPVRYHHYEHQGNPTCEPCYTDLVEPSQLKRPSPPVRRV